MTPEELSREEMEEQLRAGVFEEPQEEAPEEEDAEARGAEPHEEGESEPPEPPSMEELQERLTKLEEELGHKTGALAEERDRRRTVEGQHAMLMEAIQQARERAGQQPQPQQQQQVDDSEFEEYQDYLNAVEKKFGPVVRGIYERQQQMEQYLAQQYQAQNQVQTFAQESQRFAQEHADYNDALQFLVDKARKRATLFTQDPEQVNYAVAQAAQQLMYYQPAQLYQLAHVEGYSPRQEKTSTKPQAAQARKQPKSLGAIPGATGNLPDSFQTKAQKVVDASFRDLEKIPVEELDALLKSMG